MPIDKLAPGQEIAGHTLQRSMGRGSGGEVWLVRFSGQPAALKLFRADSLPPRIAAESVAQYALSRGSDPRARYFARAEHFDLEADLPYLRMELVAGRTLREALDTALPEPEVRALAAALLEALDYAHGQGFVHGDIKPENILLPEGENQPAIKLIDAGFGQLVQESEKPEVIHSLGSVESAGVSTPLYAPPERFSEAYRTDQTVAQAADLYMAGKVLFEALTGRTPDTIMPVSRAAPGLSDTWDELIFSLVDADPNRRPTAVQALASLRAVTPAKAPAAPKREEPDEFKLPPPLMPLAYVLLPLVALLVVALLRPDMLGGTAALALPRANEKQAGRWAERAAVIEQSGRPDLAAVYYRYALQIDPGNARSLLWLALRSADRRELDDALGRYEKLARTSPDNADAQYGLGLIYLDRKELYQARNHALRAVQLAPNKAKAHNLLGNIERTEGNHAAALAAFRSAARLDPKQPGPHHNMGVAHHGLGERTAAHRCFERALSIDPYHSETLNSMAVIAYENGDDDGLQKWMLRLRQADSGQAEALMVALARDNPQRIVELRRWLQCR